MDPYYRSIQVAHALGVECPSRLGRTLEVSPFYTTFWAGYRPNREGLARRMQLVEAYQVLAGIEDVEQLARVAPRLNRSLFTQGGAYGPRIADQMNNVIGELRADDRSRRAVAFIGNPRDPFCVLPCTLTVQFLVRRGEVNAIASMRSWDLWFGYPYDVVTFGALAQGVARCLTRVPGMVHVAAGSAHLYEKDWDSWPHKDPKNAHLDLMGPLRPGCDWSDVARYAKTAIDGLINDDRP
jgi:hypothetical protein